MFVRKQITHTITASHDRGEGGRSNEGSTPVDRHRASRGTQAEALRSGMKWRVFITARAVWILASLIVLAIGGISALHAGGGPAGHMSNPSPVLVVAAASLAALAAWRTAGAVRLIIRGRLARLTVAAAALGSVFGVATAEAFGPGIGAEDHATSAVHAVSVVADGGAWTAAGRIRTDDGISLSPLAFRRARPIALTPFRPLPALHPVAPYVPNRPSIAPRIPVRPYVAPRIPNRPFVAPRLPVRPYVAPQIPSRPYVAPQIPARPYIAPQVPIRPYLAPQIPVRPFTMPPTGH